MIQLAGYFSVLLHAFALAGMAASLGGLVFCWTVLCPLAGTDHPATRAVLALGRRGAWLTCICLVAMLLLAPASASINQTQKDKKQPTPQEPGRKDDGKVPTEKELEKVKKQEEAKPAQVQLTPAETAIELAIIAYGGRKQLESEEVRWKAITAAVGKILKHA